MESRKWQLELDDFFRNKEISNKNEQNKLLKESITIWLDYIKEKSNLILIRSSFDGIEEITIQNDRIWIDDLEISISIDTENKFLISRSNGSYVAKEDRSSLKLTKREPIQLNVDFDMHLLLQELTKILIQYK